MNHQFRHWRNSELVRLRDWVDDRADLTPTLVALRIDDRATTYGELADTIDAYVDTAEYRGLSEDAGVVAALIACAPALVAGDGAAVPTRIDEVIAWLSRDLYDYGQTPLRAIS